MLTNNLSDRKKLLKTLTLTPVIPLGGVRRLRPQGVGFTLHLEAAQVLAETILVPATKAILVPVPFAQGVSTKVLTF